MVNLRKLVVYAVAKKNMQDFCHTALVAVLPFYFVYDKFLKQFRRKILNK